jgi:hypothetical protein
MVGMIRRLLAHVAPEELLLIPVVIVVIIAVLAQPTAITRLFEGPYATPIPGDSPADLILGGERTPVPAPSPVTFDRNGTVIYDRSGTVILDRSAGRTSTGWITPLGACPDGSVIREIVTRDTSGGLTNTFVICVDAEGSVSEWGATYTPLRVRLGPPNAVTGR